MRVAGALLLLPVLAGAYSPAALFDAFRAVFPVKDGSEILAEESVFAAEAQRHLDLLGIPANLTAFCALPEEQVLGIFMKASLGNLVQDADPSAREKIRQPYLANPQTGRLEYVDNFTSNRLVVFQVLVFGLLMALGRSWYLLEQ